MALAPETWPRQFRDLIRVSNKYLLNPVMLRLAGSRYWYASVVHHVGRRSGKEYATPVVADRVGDHFLIPLPYGTQVDWLRNILAAKRARITSKGRPYEVTSPAIVAATEALPLLSEDRRRTFERTGIAHFLRMSITE
ncbi:nitroreductase/quinone reductase family protein [Mycobacterium sp. CVI_P3]|uniref:Nitroreductase/quinone reductase family protein n=1 Tax=Mycobacterium pinniadriaticum TaxID=2994102 RepID=A0ABT3S7N6_9MYCO|nr:nitroreductase/quinone reductase family protein [Mycobacterium pinniadriaticum]MCX2928960.1 nitroreductase/quinone reductase family protein [Mycobacterium pinniadriaticum]MCX2935173.1 nitroreductase/quinone reductase family protein [Mycobacterium pinniadriaticum]